MSSTPNPTPITFSKHALIIAALTAAGAFVSSLISGGAIPATIGGPIGAIIGEALIYEHSA
jgi:hypothetical protein